MAESTAITIGWAEPELKFSATFCFVIKTDPSLLVSQQATSETTGAGGGGGGGGGGVTTPPVPVPFLEQQAKQVVIINTKTISDI
jgi:hypothetical protein